MSAVVRVKRRIDEEPLSAFIINCKRPKLDENAARDSLLSSKDECSTIVKFAATLESPDEEATLQIAKLTKEEAKELASKVQKYPNALDRSRQQMREKIQENRFKVVNCYRAIETAESASKEITIVDVEKQPTDPTPSSSRHMPTLATTSAQTPTTSSVSSCSSSNDSNPAASNHTDWSTDNNYVYDLYLADELDQQYVEDRNLASDYFSVRPFDDLVYEDYNRDDLNEYDSDDSNEENYFKNEYPDTEDDDDDSSVGINDMRRRIQRAGLDDDEYDLSSDDDEDEYRNGFVYSIDSEAIGFEDDLDYCNVNRYGEVYARYRGQSSRKREAIYNDNESDYSDCYNNNTDDE